MVTLVVLSGDDQAVGDLKNHVNLCVVICHSPTFRQLTKEREGNFFSMVRYSVVMRRSLRE